MNFIVTEEEPLDTLENVAEEDCGKYNFLQ